MNNSLHISDSLIGKIVDFDPVYSPATKKIELTKTGIIRACFVADKQLFVLVQWNQSFLTMNIEQCSADQ
jgi:hypothetical protein